MHQTPWTRRASSVLSDRIRTKPLGDAKPKTKTKARLQEPIKSKEVRKLESLLTDLHESVDKGRVEKDPKGGCFCLARMHNLSPYVPLCTSCGFILCIVNLPNFACPSCSHPLLTPSARMDLIARLESDLASTLAREDEARERIAEEAQKAAGAFPLLSGEGVSSAPTAPPIAMPQAHKVLSLNSKTKKVTISSYSPASSRPVSRGVSEAETEDEPIRIPQPSADVVYAKTRVGAERPWENLTGERTTYLQPTRVDGGRQEGTEGENGGRRRRGKEKATMMGNENENERTDVTTLP